MRGRRLPPRDDLTYVTYNTIGHQIARFALRGDRTMFLFVFRSEDSGDETPPKQRLRNEFGHLGWECPKYSMRSMTSRISTSTW